MKIYTSAPIVYCMILYITAFLMLKNTAAYAQVLPSERRTNWHQAGLRDTTTNGFLVLDMHTSGLVGDGTTPNDQILASIISGITSPGAILKFPEGNFLFKKSINLPSNIIIRGEGPETTILTLSLGGSGHGINISGTAVPADTSSIISGGRKDETFLVVKNPNPFKTGDWIQLIQNDNNLVTSTWAKGTVGQIIRINAISNDTLRIASPLRLNYKISASPFIRRIKPASNSGIECVKIVRTDNTAPEQASNVRFSFATNCWVKSIESEKCTFSHVEAEYSSNLYIGGSYFHDAFDYGEGGRAYGVILHFTSNECRTENNNFRNLRHSMLLQAGANGNVFSYNYSTLPNWVSGSLPKDAAGELVLHGNYPFANLFEENICENIIIDNSHGANGPNNTFFRNRASSFGIFFSDTTSPGQNIIGNEIPNITFPYSLVNYRILGSGHFVYGNNNKGIIDPPGSQNLPDQSYAYLQRPAFVPQENWSTVGTPNAMGSGSIPARDRFNAGFLFNEMCGNYSTTSMHYQSIFPNQISIFPNPAEEFFQINCTSEMRLLKVFDVTGKQILRVQPNSKIFQIHAAEWNHGIYFIQAMTNDNRMVNTKMIRNGILGN